jgi:tetrahydromethanopterin S-methyltransferase subunit A
MQIDATRGKALKKIYEIWDALDRKMQRLSAADMVGTKDKDEIRKEVERISKETVKAVEPVFRELGIKY